MQTVSIVEISKKLDNLVKSTGVNRIIEDHEATKQALKESSATKYGAFGDVIEEPKNGLKPLTKVVDNAADAEDAADQAAITKIDPSIANTIANMKEEIPSETLTSMDKLFKSTKVTLTNIFSKAKPALETESEMLKETVTEGSIESITDTLKEVAGATVEAIDKLVAGLKSEEYTGDVNQLTTDIGNSKIVKELFGAINRLDTAISRSSSPYPSGNLLKDIAETFTGNVSSEIRSVGVTGINPKQLSSRLLNNDVVGVQNTLVQKVPFSSEMSRALGQTRFESLDEARNKLSQLTSTGVGGLNIDPADREKLLNEANIITGKYDLIAEKIKPNLGSVGATVVNEDEDTPTNPNPVNNMETVKNTPFTILNSTEEITKYFQSATRPISALIISGGNYFAEDANLTAEEAAIRQKIRYDQLIRTGKLTPGELDISNGLNHFFIRKDGTIETAKSIDKLQGRGVNKNFSIKLEVNGSYLGERSSYPPGDVVPATAWSITSWTQAQWKALDMFITAFYNTYPTGQIFGLSDVWTSKLEIQQPPFDVSAYIANSPWQKQNAQTPEEVKANGFLSPDQLAALNSTKADDRKNENNDTQ